jgi:hypothetical protein
VLTQVGTWGEFITYAFWGSLSFKVRGNKKLLPPLLQTKLLISSPIKATCVYVNKEFSHG